MTEIAVLYAGLGVTRVPWGEKHLLRRDGVIAIAIVDPDRSRKDLRPQSSIEHDYYILVWTDKDCWLGGHDGDYGFFSLTDQGTDIDWRFPFVLPENSILFEGVYVDAEEYAKAKAIFLDRDGDMY